MRNIEYTFQKQPPSKIESIDDPFGGKIINPLDGINN